MDIDTGIRNHRTGVILILFLALAAFAIWAPGADARSSYLTAFTTKYPDAASSKLNTCSLCHGSGGTSTWNSYGQAIRSIIGTNVSAATLTAALVTVEPLDSDGDTFSNFAEITALTFPGDATDHPAAAAPTITTTSPLTSGTVGTAYNQTLVATGGTTPYSWLVTVGTLPAGLSLNATTGVISGTPTTTGTSNFTVQVTGGGSSMMAFSLTINAVPDTTPPTVSSTVPDNTATGVAVGTSITATFSEPILSASVTAASFILNDGIDNVVGTLSVNGAIVTFAPSLPLLDNTTYTATITTAVTDLTGNPLAANYSSTFTTSAASPAATLPPETSGGGGCAMAGTKGDIKELAGAYGILILAALGISLRGIVKKREE
jgi:hypothetical protein